MGLEVVSRWPRSSARSVLDYDVSCGFEPLVNVMVEPAAMPLVEEWATAMGGEFREDSWE